ncbi:MAG: helix-turn-helix transcriptional regulator [Gemmatimonadota bacterium]|jgi:transcriptional regulator with XRE-family HTH domain|nr:helix-turn-helix transcriptional regulator [Gemmatimonadota bacterium]MDP6529930.1 helix-turn-helix transcriptional regulator [Gemmatimonadota bacterium]MDP6802967.1 helix-turn-helix transcriptional regulator [Gemmatimonadota bacterium]MDP7032715.1 helix-turn-helix transcriptional regulator [Gemmatimonadota bacterium]
MSDIGQNIRLLRQLKGITQTELAHGAGVAPAYISQIESDIRVPSLKIARGIAESLGTTVGVLLGEDSAHTTLRGRISKLEQLQLLQRLVLELQAELDAEDAVVEDAGAAEDADDSPARRASGP